MVANVVVLGVESRNASALGTAMVNQLLKEALNLPARKTTSSLEERTETTAIPGFPAGNFLSVLVPAVVVESISLPSEPSELEANVSAVATSVAVDAFSSDAQCHGGSNEHIGETHTVRCE